jgi:PII-like signaling protein
MNGTLLRCYMHENDRHNGQPVWESLIRHANKIGIRGGSVFKAMAGFGRHHIVHEGPRPFDFHATQTVEVEFLVTDADARGLLHWVEQQGMRLFYATTPARFGTVDSNAAEPPKMAADS